MTRRSCDSERAASKIWGRTGGASDTRQRLDSDVRAIGAAERQEVVPEVLTSLR